MNDFGPYKQYINSDTFKIKEMHLTEKDPKVNTNSRPRVNNRHHLTIPLREVT